MLHKWLDGKYYARSKGEGDRTVVIPPPNVTGVLHMGHALDDTIQDTYIRYSPHARLFDALDSGHRPCGHRHADEGRQEAQGRGYLTVCEIGREKFLDECQKWRDEYGGIIVEQIKRMGCSVDFDDEKFTMSPEYAKAVRKVFCDWYHDDMIYRGKRIVNWCPSCTTAISDDEAEYKDEKGHLWHLRYPLDRAG